MTLTDLVILCYCLAVIVGVWQRRTGKYDAKGWLVLASCLLLFALGGAVWLLIMS